MTVRRKVQDTGESSDKIDLRRHLARVRDAITQLPGEHIMTDPVAVTEAPRKVTKKTGKKAGAKKANGAAKSDVAKTTLADICKPLKLKPGKARRILRGAKVKNPGRWSWTKGDAAIKKVTSLLREATKDS